MRDVEIPKWLEGLPLAPEFRPTDTEFADPIAYISKIEKEASAFGICKVIPPLPKPSRKFVLHNLNRTLSKCPELGSDVDMRKMNDGVEGTSGSEVRAVFTTRHQELGQAGKRAIGVPKQVWQSGEVYTLEQFEAKSKTFAKSQLGMLKEVSPLAVEVMFWKSASEKPIYVEYANDVPGSGFAEPEGSFRYFNRRRRWRRKRGTFDKNNQGNSCSENDPVADSTNIVSNSIVDKNADVTNLRTQQPQLCPSVSSLSSDQSEISSEGKFSNASNEMHGTAGWKLSNSSWNLQVIARSPGSLTRYMPDDIPGVTSPMVYIGMLFSWFAWHVEDHELHSLNFLHMGSPKTWYSVPGDFASSFEEVIRVHTYGRGTNPLDALTLLGEKTTLVSPEVIVESGIPCCRLVQNPGEFVVTFPRAYHVGFSHGFNCGEAANFCTPKWLTVAKEAAVRRAAMNYLPMLSHQQLLYLLTMSFVARVPRSLLPGARSSRLRDRQKEEREVAVKKAFIEDILKENHLLTILLQKNSSYHVVSWNLDLLPGSIKDSKLCGITDSIELGTGEDSVLDKYNVEDLYTQMNLYMDTVTDFYVDNADDLQNDFQVDSGTLPCVACGILGFPFMAVVQPSRDPLPESQGLVPQTGVAQPMGAESRVLNVRVEGTALEHTIVSSAIEQERSWNLSNGCLRPRLFCLEHAIQTVELLQPKGGANVLGICHSDFQKIKAHSAVVAEEISSPFTYNEIPLGTASQEDLYLIDLAIDNQEKEVCEQDWTSELNINMQHSVNMRKNFPSQKVKHALTLDGLFSDAAVNVNAFKWQSRKSRSKRGSNPSILNKPSLSIETVKVENAVVKLDDEMSSKQGQVTIQYYRKRYRSKPRDFGVRRVDSDKQHPKDLPGADSSLCHDKKPVDMSDSSLVRVEGAGNFSSGSSLSASCGKSLIQSEENISTSKLEDSLTDINLVDETVDGHPGNCISEEQVKMNKKCDATVYNSEKFPIIHVIERTAENHDLVKFGNSTGSLCVSSNVVSEIGFENRMCDPLETDESGRQRDVQMDGDVFMKDVSNDTNSCCYADDSSGARSDEHTETTGVDKCGMNVELVNCSTETQNLPTKGEDEEKDVSFNDHMSSECYHALAEEAESPGEMPTCEHQRSSSQGASLPVNKELDDVISREARLQPTGKSRSKRKRVDTRNEDPTNLFGKFIRSPCEGLRPRAKSDPLANVTDSKKHILDKKEARKANNHSDGSVLNMDKKVQKKGSHRCNVEGCRMSFQTKAELVLHMRNRCPVQGCGKKFNSHKYAVLHQRVHDDDRPLKCPWKGCTMTFKWAWARTEHIRVHTGERPYKCKVQGCDLTFRFVSDFSRHRRKTGHYVN